MKRIYCCIDLKSFYASVECRERKLDPLRTNLVVADKSRTEKTICLAVTPSLKKYGLSGRSRLYEVIQKVKEVNNLRKKENNYKKFNGKSYDDIELSCRKDLELTFVIAKPQMYKYMKYSNAIYNIYLKYIAPEDIYVYSIDEVFIDLTSYLNTYKLSPEDLVTKMIKDVYDNLCITATAGIGTNMYLAKIAMDIVAKHMEPNEFGVRIASIDEMSYRKLLWNHRPLIDFWRIGPGIAKKLEKHRMFTMGDICRCSLKNEDLLYKLFGINAELIIDHAWGYEPVTIKDIMNYKPERSSISLGQVLHEPYDYKKTKLIVKEMIDNLSLDLVDKKVVTNKLVLSIGYDVINLIDPNISKKYFGEVTLDHYGRSVPKHAHGTINIDYRTSSNKILSKKIIELYNRIINKDLMVRRINIVACDIVDEKEQDNDIVIEQLDLFSNIDNVLNNEKEKIDQKEENKLQHALLDIKKKYGKNAILRGMNFEDGGTARDRNKQVGGHNG